MNRQYKFRGKRKDTWEWAYGNLCENVLGNVIIQVITITQLQRMHDTFIVIPETVGQFTNKLDSELKDVFEGDIVQGGNGKMWEVIYSLTVSGWVISNKRIKDSGRSKFAGNEEYSFDRYRQLCKNASTDTFKKIGNIYDNPELLNPLADSPALNTMNNFDPGTKAEEVKEEAQAPAEQAAEGTEGEGQATEE